MNMIANPLLHMYAPKFIDVLVATQGQDICELIVVATQQNRTSVVYDKVMYSQNMQLLRDHGFRVASIPPAMTIADLVVKYTISWE